MGSLYNLTADYEKLLNMLYDEGANEEAIIDTLDSIEDAIEVKADGYAMIIKELEADVNKCDQEAKRLQDRKRVLNNKISLLKYNLEQAMRVTGKTKFKTSLFSFGIQKNGGKRALVLDCDIDKLPPELQSVTITANNEAIRKMLETDGIEANQYAHLAEQGESLRIR